MTYEIYCDGSCRKNGSTESSAAYGWVILYNNEPIRKGAGRLPTGSTNNMAEMTGMIKALEYWKENYEGSVIVYSDSAYIVNAYNQHWIDNWHRNGWKTANKTPVKNKELWQELYPYFKDTDRVKLEKVPAHSGVLWNEMVDNIAQEASLNLSS